jgi:3-dehydroquinate synthetase
MNAASALGWTPRAVTERAVALLDALGLPGAAGRDELAAAWPFVSSDKKRSGDAIRLPVVTKVGEARLERVRLTDLRKALLPPA